MNTTIHEPSRHVRLLRLLIGQARSGLLSDLTTEEVLRDENGQDGDPTRLVDDLEALGPTFIKLGQMLSSRPDLFPQPHLDALSRLQDDVAPFAYGDARRMIEDELGHDIGDLFADFDPDPIAAASLAQVHRACLLDGREVAVKVQRPDVRARVRDDLHMLDRAASTLEAVSEQARRFAVGDLVDQFRDGLTAELDLRREADNLVAMGRVVERYDHLVCPQPVFELTSSRILTMDWVDGRNVATLGQLARTDIDGRTLSSELIQCYLDQILLAGFVHADPHPGNVLLTSDGTLALIDLGMVTRLGSRRQTQLLEMFLAMAEGRAGDFVDGAARMGTPLEDFDADKLERIVTDILGRFRHASAAPLRAGDVLVLVSRAATEVGLRPAPELTLVGKALAQLDQVIGCLCPDLDVAEVLHDHASDLLLHHAENKTSTLRAARVALQSARFIEELPGRANRILDDLVEGDLTVRIEALDQDELMRGLEKVATRITVGLVLASMVIGAALALRVDSDLRLLGSPAIAIVFFVLAGLCGLGLVAHVAITDRKDRRRRSR